MKIDYDYYFKNNGVCPSCKEIMTLHDGCVNWNNCNDCKNKMMKDEQFFYKIIKIIRTFGIDNLISKTMKHDWKKENLDKSRKKSYIKIDDKRV